MHSGNLVNGLGRIMHLPSARALSRPRPLTRLLSCTKTRNARQSGMLMPSHVIDSEASNSLRVT